MSRVKLSKLRRKVREVSEQTKQTHEEVTQKRAAKRVVQKRPEAESEPRPKPVNTVDVERWFREGIFALYDRPLILSRWGVKERALAKKLLKTYGDDLTKRTVEHFCREWPDLLKRSRGRISGVPTVMLLWAMRDSVFSDVQLGAVKPADPARTDEYREDEDSPDAGW
jgi:hypothetical protein